MYIMILHNVICDCLYWGGGNKHFLISDSIFLIRFSSSFTMLNVKGKKVKVVLYSAISGPLDRSKRFTLLSFTFSNSHVLPTFCMYIFRYMLPFTAFSMIPHDSPCFMCVPISCSAFLSHSSTFIQNICKIKKLYRIICA